MIDDKDKKSISRLVVDALMTGRMKELICIITKNRTLPTLGSFRPENKRYVEQERKVIFLWQLT